MNRLFALALLAGASIALLNPSLLPFVVGGIALALAPSLVRLVQVAPRAVKIALKVLSVSLVLAGAGAWLVFVQRFYEDSEWVAGSLPDISVPIHYSGQASQQGEALSVEDSLTVGRSGLRRAARKAARFHILGEGYPYRELESRLVDTISARLEAKGWKSSADSEGIEFRRRRPPLALIAGWFPARTTNTILVRPPGMGRVARGKPRNSLIFLEEPRITPHFDETSSLTVTAEPYTIGDTSPRGSRRPRGGMERVTIPVPTDDDRVEVEVASPLLRNAVGSRLGHVTLFSTTGWVMMLLLAVTGDWAKGLLKRLFRRIFPPRQPTSGEAKEGESNHA